MYADQLINNDSSTIIGGLVAAKVACQRLRDRGAVVLSVTIAGGRPLILIERPSRKLKETGEIVRLVQDNDGRRVVREYDFEGCRVTWDEQR